MPKYIGFLEYLQIPDVTSLLTLLNLIGLTVVFDFMNLKIGFIKIRNPIESIIIEIVSLYGRQINSSFFDEKQTEVTKINAKIGGGIFNILYVNI